jgi:hypothetical protein
MRRSAILVLFLSAILFSSSLSHAQGDGLKPGVAVERTLAAGQSHTYTVALEADQVLQLVVDQRGIDVVVRAFSPDGALLGEFDSPNGTEGPENVSLISTTAGSYRIEVAPLGQQEDPQPGRYEIKILELRAATEQELQAGKNQVALKARGIALLTELAEALPQLRLPQTRVHAQLRAAELLSGSDDKLAGKLINDAMDGVKEYLAKVDLGDPDYYTAYQVGMQMRIDVVHAVSGNDPDAALAFLRATRGLLPNPDNGNNGNPQGQELAIELSLAGSIASKDPKRSFQIAEDTLKKGFSNSLIDALTRLRSKDQELAAKLASDIATKLEGAKLLETPEAAGIATQLLWLAHSNRGRPQAANADHSSAKPDTPLLSDQDYRDLFTKTLGEGMAYNVPAGNVYSPERNSAQNILNALKSMTKEMQTYAPSAAATIEKKFAELNTPADPQALLWQKYQETVNNGTAEAATEVIGKAPREMRDQLYQQLATNLGSRGDVARAKQILNDNLSNPIQKRQALNNLEQFAIRNAMNHGKVEEAMRGIANLRSPHERAMLLSQVVNQIGPGLKRANAMAMLEQARGMITTSGQAEDQDQMNALLEISHAFARYDQQRAFEILEPLLDQFNEMTTAATALNGFGQQYYKDGELLLNGSNPLAAVAQQLGECLGSLTPANFDHAKAGADRLQRQEARIEAYLSIAEQAISPEVTRVRHISNF